MFDQKRGGRGKTIDLAECYHIFFFQIEIFFIRKKNCFSVVKAEVEKIESCDSQVLGYLSLWFGVCTQSCWLTLLLLKEGDCEEVSAAVHLKKEFLLLFLASKR